MQLQIADSLEALNISIANWLVNYIKKVLQKQDRFTIALSGGNTPKSLHLLLSSENYKHKIDWSKLHFFWGDERFVPITDEKNNAKMAFDTLLNKVPVLSNQIHIIPTENCTPEESAVQYQQLLEQYFHNAYYTFDLVFLGMGDDGHTLSLFPHTPIIHEKEKWVDSFWLANQNMYRVTLTAPLVNQAACVVFVATGTNKSTVLKKVLQGEKNVDEYPSQIIQPKGELFWFVDKAAASDL